MHQDQRSQQVIQHSGGVVRVVQLTDTHLCKSRGGTLLGMDTDHSLQAVIDLVNGERDKVDLLLATGDLSDHGYPEAYRRLLDYFDQVAPHFWLTGNHDDRESMNVAMGDGNRLFREIRVAGWQIVMLDSQIPGQVGGRLGDAEIEFLDRALQAARDAALHTLVCMHHQPVAVGTPWLDQQMIDDADALFATLDRYPGVRALLWGHVHQQVDRQRGDVKLLASPSTCVQFAPGYQNFQADDQPPGYRWLDLHPDGTVETGVSRVRDVHFNVDLQSGGYV